jgi:hypothetical protein
MGRACGTYEGNRVLVGKETTWTTGRVWGIILKWVFKREGMKVWTGVTWLRTGTGGALL